MEAVGSAVGEVVGVEVGELVGDAVRGVPVGALDDVVGAPSDASVRDGLEVAAGCGEVGEAGLCVGVRLGAGDSVV